MCSSLQKIRDRMFDVHIIGAGPAGSIAAITAAKKGKNILVSEEHSSAGAYSCCSGLLSRDGLQSLSEFIDYKKFIVNEMRGAIIDFSGEQIIIDARKPIGFVIDRPAFDRALAENAAAAGVQFEFRKRISMTSQFQSQNIIGADGPFSFVAEAFKFPRIGRFLSTLKANVKYKAGDSHMVEIFLSNEKFPGLFGWIIPHSERDAEIGVGVSLGKPVIDAFRHLLSMKKISKYEHLSGDVIPIAVRQKTAAAFKKYNVLLVGDAAGQVKSTTGGGIIFGGNCAKIAGSLADVPYQYESEWRKRFGADLFIHHLMRSYLDKRTDQEIAAIGANIKRLNLHYYLSRNGNMDMPLKMIKPELFLHLLNAFKKISTSF